MKKARISKVCRNVQFGCGDWAGTKYISWLSMATPCGGNVRPTSLMSCKDLSQVHGYAGYLIG